MLARKRLAATSSALALTVLLTVGSIPRLSASPIQVPVTFSTSGTVDSLGSGDPPIIRFAGFESLTETTGDTLHLGRFYVSSLGNPVDKATAFVGVPYQIMVHIQSINGVPTVPNDDPILIQGALTAVVTPQGVDTIAPKFPSYGSIPEESPPFNTSVTPFRIGDYIGYLSLRPSEDLRGVEAILNITPIPEPTSMLVFAGVAGLVALRARRSRS
jgi:hypothetical protein